MLYIEQLLYAKILFEIHIYFILFNFIYLFIYYYFLNNKYYYLNFKNTIYLKFLKKWNLFSLLLSFFLFFISFCFYFNFLYFNSLSIAISTYNIVPNLTYFNGVYLFNIFNFQWLKINFNLDFFGYVLLFLAYFVGFISLISLDNKIYWKNFKYYTSFYIFIFIVSIFISSTNLIFFFLSYECLLLPSFLFVYFISYSRRSIQASIYFVIWTQIGSLIVLCCISYLLVFTNNFFFFSLKSTNLTELENFLLLFFLFLGFGIKVPIWPFHYWLTKTHVEAPSGFSIYLSGFLVKSALYGFYKLTNQIFNPLASSFFIIICIFGIIDSSLKMWGQTDLKKLVAYGTIQEMNLIFLIFCWGDINCINVGILFSITHACLSAIMFYLVDCIYRRYHTRSIVEINGILQFTPNLSICVVIMLLFFSGLPGTIKYIVEFYIFSGFLEISPTNCFILMLLANGVGLIGFSKCWFNIIFGCKFNKYHFVPLDLNIKEIYIFAYCFLLLFIISYFSYICF